MFIHFPCKIFQCKIFQCKIFQCKVVFLKSQPLSTLLKSSQLYLPPSFLYVCSSSDFLLDFLFGRRQKGNVSDGWKGTRRACLLITCSSAATRPPNTAPILTCIQTQIQVQIHKQSLFNKQCQGSTKQKTFISTWCEDI